jgi:hypothetical protein
MAIQNYSHTQPFDYGLQSKNSVSQMVAKIGIQWTFDPERVLF